MVTPLIYLAGPITKPDPNVNCREAILIADRLMGLYNIALFTPQLSVLHQMIQPRTHEDWLEYDFGVIQNCHAIIRIPGASIGADMEELYAYKMGIPTFYLSEYGHLERGFADWLDEHTGMEYEPVDPHVEDRARIAAIAYGREARAAHEDYGFAG